MEPKTDDQKFLYDLGLAAETLIEKGDLDKAWEILNGRAQLTFNYKFEPSRYMRHYYMAKVLTAEEKHSDALIHTIAYICAIYEALKCMPIPFSCSCKEQMDAIREAVNAADLAPLEGEIQKYVWDLEFPPDFRGIKIKVSEWLQRK